MKTNIIGFVVTLVLAIAGTAGLCAQNSRVSQVRKVNNFSSIDLTSVADIYFKQGAKCSLKIEGTERNVNDITTRVKEGCLYIGMKDQDKKRRVNTRRGRNTVKIYITAPDLKKLDLDGVGSFNCSGPLDLGDVELDFDGVGDINIDDLTCRHLDIDLSGVGGASIHMNCDRLEADIDGVGNVTLSGRAGWAHISKDGVGHVNTRRLEIGKE